MALVINETLESELIVAEELPDYIVLFIVEIEDNGWFEDVGISSGEVYETWALNTGKFYASVYTGFTFNSYGILDETTYGAREDGIFAIEGDSDAGNLIYRGVVFSPTMFGIMNKKHLRKGFFDIEGNAAIIRVETEGRGASLAIVNGKVVFPRDLVGKKWTVMIADFDELGMIELFPVIITR